MKSRWRRRLLVSTLLAALIAAIVIAAASRPWSVSPESPAEPEREPWTGPPLFQNMTAASGIDFTFRNGEETNNFAILEAIGGGVGLIDYDGDGLLDIFLIGGGYFDGPNKRTIKGHPCRLYKNLGNFKFKDVTREAGLDQPLFFSHGVSVCDYDKDGWPDLLVTGYGRVALFRNVPGANRVRTFVEVTKAAGLDGAHGWGTSAGWADFDGDGWPDVYICQYVNWSWTNDPTCAAFYGKAPRDICPPGRFKALPHKLYRNNGKGHFIDVTARAGLRVQRDDEDYGKGLGVVIVDVDGDGKPDIYVANDTSGNFLYLNRSTSRASGEADERRDARGAAADQVSAMKFEEVGIEAGVAKNGAGGSQGSMGVDAGDPYGTGLPALWATNFEGELHALYRNDLDRGRPLFHFATSAAGIAAIGPLYVGFGTGFVDLDNDGWEDIFISNGHVARYPYPGKVQQNPVVFLNQGHGKFIQTKAAGDYCRTGHRGRGVAIGDLDNDGRPDLVISHVQEPVAVLRNVADSGNHWLGVKLASKDRRNLVGTKVVLEVNGRKLTRFAKGGGSYLSANDTRLLFGLGKDGRSGKLTVHWPGGEPRVERWNDLDIDGYHTLEQGMGIR
jgi:hypothetical protein